MGMQADWLVAISGLKGVFAIAWCQVNSFTLTIPAATVDSSGSSCGAAPSGTGFTCLTFSSGGQTASGWVQGAWIGEDTCYGSGNGESTSCTNGGIEVH